MTHFTKNIAAAAIAVSALAGSMALTTTAVVTTTAAVSVITATPASARTCKTFVGKGFANALFNRAGERRAGRKAVRNWKSQVKDQLGRNFAKIGNTKPQCKSVKGQNGQSGFQTCTVVKRVCGS